MRVTDGSAEVIDGAPTHVESAWMALCHASGKRQAKPVFYYQSGRPPLLMASVLAPAIQEFQSHRPELRFQLFDSDTTSVMQKVQPGALDMGMGVFFKYLPGVRRVRLFRFSLMVIHADNGNQSRGATTTWSALEGEKLISLPPSIPLQHLVDRHLAKAGVTSA
jgi:DNA-binding transcriptional LysR family regulator